MESTSCLRNRWDKSIRVQGCACQPQSITLKDSVISHSPVHSFNLHTDVFRLLLFFLTWKHDGCFIPQLGQLLQSSTTPDLISEDEDEDEIYPPELQLNKANTSDTEAPFLDLHLSISNGFVSSKIYDKRDDFDFDIVNFSFLDGDVPRRPSYGVYISQLIRFARVCSHVDDFNTRKKCLTAKLLKQGYQYHKLRKAFSKFYRRHYELISKFNVGFK